MAVAFRDLVEGDLRNVAEQGAHLVVLFNDPIGMALQALELHAAERALRLADAEIVRPEALDVHVHVAHVPLRQQGYF